MNRGDQDVAAARYALHFALRHNAQKNSPS